jgi:hypothetical protein
MTRYYFHIRDADGMSRDNEGTELPNLEAARREARASGRDLIADAMKSRRLVAGQMLDIADEQGVVIETLTVSDLIV